MPETDNPRTFVRPKPIPVPPHRGLKITARNSTIYTCEIPSRKQVAHENYTRRTHQMTKCGYRSVNYKPYQSIGDVILDDKKLILTALGQDGDQITQVILNFIFIFMTLRRVNEYFISMESIVEHF